MNEPIRKVVDAEIKKIATPSMALPNRHRKEPPVIKRAPNK
jgi:hypothetical protein